MIVYIWGFMAAGKSSIGKILAKKLKANFIDLDAEIEKKNNFSIHSFFKILNEDEFRKSEKKMLTEITNDFNGVISVGGGTPCFFDNADFMLSNGLAVYIDINEDILMKRLQKSVKKRPLYTLSGKTSEERIEKMKLLNQNRKNYYNKANFIFNINDETASEIAEKIYEKINPLWE